MSSFSIDKVQKRNIALDIMKCIGVLCITNAHSWDLWEVINSRIAVGGAQGVTIFFFVSGFAMMIGSTKNKTYDDFLCDKLKRLWPPTFLWLLFVCIFFKGELSIGSFFALEFHQWFISCIFIYYAILYFAVNRKLSTKRLFMLGGVVFACCMLVILPKAEHSVYVDYHYYMYFTSMALGMIIGERVQQTTDKKDIKAVIKILFLLLSIFFFFSYFLIVYYCSGSDNSLYYAQLLNLVPLNLMVLFLYFAFDGKRVKDVVINNKFLRNTIILVSQLSLEIYIVQFTILTGRFNSLFPLSFLINAVLVLLFAYILRIMTNAFIHIFDKHMTLKQIFVI